LPDDVRSRWIDFRDLRGGRGGGKRVEPGPQRIPLNQGKLRVQCSEAILAEQLAYYRSVASEYGYDGTDMAGLDEIRAAVDAFCPTGDVLELACGTGIWTERLARSATSITAVDAAPEMLARAATRGGAESVRFIEADLFEWRPDRRYNTVVFGFWLSHVPEQRFERFWNLVSDCLRPGGEVFFFDDNHRTEAELIEGSNSSIIERRLSDGTAFRVVKASFRAPELEGRLRALGWNVSVTPTAGPFYWGTGCRS
jgi:demethylmenaquinone methyltransferase/2-methoxy-6-polyprenyl-1,4-benzoquinol methylase